MSFLIGVRGLAVRFALQIMFGAAFGAGERAVQAIVAAHVPVTGRSFQPHAASFPMADVRPADAASDAPGFIGPGWGLRGDSASGDAACAF